MKTRFFASHGIVSGNEADCRNGCSLRTSTYQIRLSWN
jgi:hypothetical protein